MSRFRMLVAVASMTLLPSMALATVYDFHDTETSALSPSPVSFTFSLDTATAGSGGGGTVFSNVSINENGTVFPGNSVGATFTTNLSSPLFFFVDTGSEPFYSGSGTSITFNVGTFSIANGATDGEGKLSISAASAAPVPEPATWTLLFAGVALAAALRFARQLSSRTIRRLSC